MNDEKIGSYSSVLTQIKDILRTARHNAFTAVNTEMLKAYFEIGRKIVEEEQRGKMRAEYGEQLIRLLSKELSEEFGKGYGVTALKSMRRFYIVYKNQISRSMTDQFYNLTWTHYCELIKIKDGMKKYEKV